MDPLNTQVVIEASVFVAALIMVLIVAGIAFVALLLRRKSRQVETLSQRLADLEAEPGSSKIDESYRQFIYNISHEVSNPLQSVQTNLEVMADCSPEETGRWKQYYVIIKQEIRRLFTLTENLRLLSQLESSETPIQREPVNLRSVIEDVIMAQTESATQHNVIMKYHGPHRPAKVLGHRGSLHQLINNLVDNSIKYSKDSGGTIIIELTEDKASMHLRVIDDGIGVPEEDLPHIFDTAYRSPRTPSVGRAGSGLGLAITKRIVGQHDGEIGVSSVLGEGTTISIALPLYDPASPEGTA